MATSAPGRGWGEGSVVVSLAVGERLVERDDVTA